MSLAHCGIAVIFNFCTIKTIHLLWLFVSLFTFFSCSSEIEGDEDRLLIGNDFANHEEIENKFDYSQLSDFDIIALQAIYSPL